MRWLAILVVLISPMAALGQDYSFGDWARGQGYEPGDVMPGYVDGGYGGCWPDPCSPAIDSLSGINEFDWTTTPTTELLLYDNQISSIEPGVFSELTNLRQLLLHGNQISRIEPGVFSELTNLTELALSSNQLSGIETSAFSGLTSLDELYLSSNQISSIEPGAFSGLANLEFLSLDFNTTLTELNLTDADFLRLDHFGVRGNVNITSVSLRNTVVNQTSLARLMDGGTVAWGHQLTGIGKLDGITEMDLSGIDFDNITDLGPLYVMDDLTDLWLVDTANLDATGLDVLLDNLETIEGTDTEGILYMTGADFDAFNTAGDGLLADWDAEPGHHVAFVIPEPSSFLLCIALSVVGALRKWGV